MTRALADVLIAATASSSVSLPRARIATSAPDAANRIATAKPMPLLPPVTMAERLFKLISMTVSLTHFARHHTMDFLARRLAHRLVIEQQGCAAERLADQFTIEGGVKPAHRIAV